MLPKVLPHARILTWGYNANVTALLGSASADRIMQHAQTLVAQLEADRAVGVLALPAIRECPFSVEENKIETAKGAVCRRRSKAPRSARSSSSAIRWAESS